MLVNRRMRVFEHQFVPVGTQVGAITEVQVDELQGFRPGDDAIMEACIVKGKFGIKFKQYAGVVNFSDGSSLEILPKIAQSAEEAEASRSVILHMMEKTLLPPNAIGKFGQTSKSTHLLDCFVEAFQHELWSRLREGYHREYRAERFIDNTIRGRIDFGRQLSQAFGRHDRFFQSYQVFSPDTAVNRVLAAALHSMHRAVENNSLRARVFALKTLFSDLGVGQTPDLTGKPKFDRIDDRWRVPYLLAKQWLDRVGGGERNSHIRQAIGPSILFDMNVLFEEYVRANLRSFFPTANLTQTSKPMFSDSDRNPILTLKPDAEIEEGKERFSCVFDAKWKIAADNQDIHFSPHDLRQIYAYSKILGYRQCALVYPTISETPFYKVLRSNETEEARLTIFQLPIGPSQSLARRTVLARLLFDRDVDPESISAA